MSKADCNLFEKEEQYMNNIDILEEKEKEAIKDLEEYLHWEELQGFSMLPRDKHIETLLNLVETLIAENKELKEKIKEINEEYNAEQKHEMENTIPKSKVEELKEEKEYEKELRIKYERRYNLLKESSIKKRKIEELIEGLEKEQEEIKENEWILCSNINRIIIKVLQSLLGKE